MNIVQFARQVSVYEGLKKQVNIAQILEILKVINCLLGGSLYTLIKRDLRVIDMKVEL